MECGWCGSNVPLQMPTDEHPGIDVDGKPYAAPHPGELQRGWGPSYRLDCRGSYRSITEHGY